jgi:hypothetical protein
MKLQFREMNTVMTYAQAGRPWGDVLSDEYNEDSNKDSLANQ